MKLINKEEFFTLADDLDVFPFCFQKDYLVAQAGIFFLLDNDTIVPVKINRNKFLKTLQFQFTPLFLNGISLEKKEERMFLEKAIDFITKNKLAHRIIQPKNYVLFNVLPDNVKSCPFGTYRIVLAGKTGEKLLEAMQARYRSAIRQTEKLNVEIKYGLSELQSFQKLHSETMDRTNAYSENYDSLKKELTSAPNNTILATVYIDNNIQGGLYIAYSKFCAYYFHGASAHTTQASGAIKYLHYKIMCMMQDKGVVHYDFVGARLSDVSGTKLEGIQNFKKRFGSQLIKGYLWKLDIDKARCSAYDNLLKIKCKLKRTKFPLDIIDQEKNKKIIL